MSDWRIAWPPKSKQARNTYNNFDSGPHSGDIIQSGFGRDLGAYALEQYTNVKSVWVAL